MLTAGAVHAPAPGDGRVAELGIARMPVLAAGTPTGRAFSLVECSGDAGPWTVPHVHRRTRCPRRRPALTDPAARAAVASAYDSVPV